MRRRRRRWRWRRGRDRRTEVEKVRGRNENGQEREGVRADERTPTSLPIVGWTHSVFSKISTPDGRISVKINSHIRMLPSPAPLGCSASIDWQKLRREFRIPPPHPSGSHLSLGGHVDLCYLVLVDGDLTERRRVSPYFVSACHIIPA